MRINKDICDVCGSCVSVCAVDAIIVTEFEVNIDNDKFINCMKCMKICPVSAIEEGK